MNKPKPYGIADFDRVLTQDRAETAVELLRLLDEHGFDTEDEQLFWGLHDDGRGYPFRPAAENALEALNDEELGIVVDGAVLELRGDKLVVGRAEPVESDGGRYPLPSRSSWGDP